MKKMWKKQKWEERHRKPYNNNNNKNWKHRNNMKLNLTWFREWMYNACLLAIRIFMKCTPFNSFSLTISTYTHWHVFYKKSIKIQFNHRDRPEKFNWMTTPNGIIIKQLKCPFDFRDFDANFAFFDVIIHFIIHNQNVLHFFALVWSTDISRSLGRKKSFLFYY